MRLSRAKRRAVVVLFLSGFSFRSVARLLGLSLAAATDVVRQYARGQ